MRILVTGGAGFIGSNLVYALLSGGHRVTVVDDLSTGSVGNIHPASEFREMDVLDAGLLEIMVRTAPEAVVHLAAQASVQVSIADPALDHRVNVEGTAAVAEAAVAAGTSRLVFASSAAVYGEPAEVPLRETSPKSPSNPYGANKLAAEAELARILRPGGVDHAALRFANVFGPRQDWRGEGGVVAIFAHRIASGQAPVIYGDGTQTRDLIYVGDVVGAILSALEHRGHLAGEGADGPAYNISTGTETSVLELAMSMGVAAHAVRPPEFADARQGDILRSALDPAKAAATFGWRSGVPLDTALGRTFQWVRDEG